MDLKHKTFSYAPDMNWSKTEQNRKRKRVWAREREGEERGETDLKCIVQ